MPGLPLELRASRLFAALLALVLAAAIAAAFASHHPWTLKAPLLLAVAALLAQAWRDERRRGLRRVDIECTDDGPPVVVFLRRADGHEERARYAGHAILGVWVIFIFLERQGWRRFLGPARIAVARDAVPPDDFRRLRARVRLGL